jgi:hypothetical protein
MIVGKILRRSGKPDLPSGIDLLPQDLYVDSVLLVLSLGSIGKDIHEGLELEKVLVLLAVEAAHEEELASDL